MDNFPQIIAEWHDFYLALAGVSATLIGLLFVAISLSVEFIYRQKFADLRNLGTQSFINFMYMLLIALLFLVPNLTSAGIGGGLTFIGGFGLFDTISQFIGTIRRREHLLTTSHLYAPFFFPTVAFIIILVVAFSILGGSLDLLSWLVIALAILTVSASRTAWDFLLRSRSNIQERGLPPVDTSEA